MIKNFRNKNAEDIWNGRSTRKFPASLQRRAYRKLLMLEAAESILDLAAGKGNNLEKIKGVRDTWSIRINDQYRVCFVWKTGDAYDVSVEDYHS